MAVFSFRSLVSLTSLVFALDCSSDNEPTPRCLGPGETGTEPCCPGLETFGRLAHCMGGPQTCYPPDACLPVGSQCDWFGIESQCDVYCCSGLHCSHTTNTCVN
jgi:hypothetical protein